MYDLRPTTLIQLLFGLLFIWLSLHHIKHSPFFYTILVPGHSFYLLSSNHSFFILYFPLGGAPDILNRLSNNPNWIYITETSSKKIELCLNIVMRYKNSICNFQCAKDQCNWISLLSVHTQRRIDFHWILARQIHYMVLNANRYQILFKIWLLKKSEQADWEKNWTFYRPGS